MSSIAICKEKFDTSISDHQKHLLNSDKYQQHVIEFDNAKSLRSYLENSQEISSVWILSSHDIEPINVAACIKSNHEELDVYLFDPSGSGSLFGRCEKAHVIPVFGKESLCALLKNQLDHLIVHEAPTITQGTTHAQEKVASGLHPNDRELFQQRIANCSQSITQNNSVVISVVSGSGGVGKSTVSLLIAELLHRRAVKVALVDGDFMFGDLSALAPHYHHFSSSEFAKQALRLTAHLDNNPALNREVFLVTAPPQLEECEGLVRKLPLLLETLSGYFDVIIVNTGCCWSDEHLALFSVSTHTLFLMDQRPSSIKSCNHGLEFCTRAGIPLQNFYYLLNFTSKQGLISSLEASCALQGNSVFEIADGGKEVNELTGAGLFEELVNSGNPLSESLKKLLLQLFPHLQNAPNTQEEGKKRRRGFKRK